MPVDNAAPHVAWAERAAERSPLVQRSRTRSIEQAKVIVEAARRLLSTQGEFTTQELAKEAGVALQTFYRYFASKDLLLVAVIEDMVAEQAAMMEAGTESVPNAIERLQYYVTQPLLYLESDVGRQAARTITAEHWRLHQLFPEEIANASRPMVELLRRTLHDARLQGALTATDADRDAWLIVELVRSTFHHCAFAKLDRPLTEVADQVWQFCLRGIAGDSTNIHDVVRTKKASA